MSEIKEFTDKTQTEGVNATEKVHRVLLEVLVPGKWEKRESLKKRVNELQEQLNKSRKAGSRVRVMFYCDKEDGDMTMDDVKQWLMNRAHSKYIAFAPDIIPSDYIKESLIRIKKLEDSIERAKSYGIKPLPKLAKNTIKSNSRKKKTD